MDRWRTQASGWKSFDMWGDSRSVGNVKAKEKKENVKPHSATSHSCSPDPHKSWPIWPTHTHNYCNTVIISQQKSPSQVDLWPQFQFKRFFLTLPFITKRVCILKYLRWYLSIMHNTVLTLDPVATDWTEKVWVQAMRFLNLVQKFPDVHHLQITCH